MRVAMLLLMQLFYKNKGWTSNLLKIYPDAKGVPGSMVIRIAATRHVDSIIIPFKYSYRLMLETIKNNCLVDKSVHYGYLNRQNINFWRFK